MITSQVDSGPELHAMGIPCFTAGTMILTPTGERPIEGLRVGDLVTTVDDGPQPIRWVSSTALGDGTSDLPGNVMPVRIKPGALGNIRPLIVSPQHCIQMQDVQTGQTAYVRAKHLAEETKLASYARGRKQVTYFHLLMDRHQTLVSNEIPSESFYPGPFAMEMLSAMNRLQLYVLIPGLAQTGVESAYGPRAEHVLRRRDLRKWFTDGKLGRPNVVSSGQSVPAVALVG
jgi:hypothetical protein